MSFMYVFFLFSGRFHLDEPSRVNNNGACNYLRHPNIITFVNSAMKQSKAGNFIYFVKTKIMGEPPVQIRYE